MTFGKTMILNLIQPKHLALKEWRSNMTFRFQNRIFIGFALLFVLIGQQAFAVTGTVNSNGKIDPIPIAIAPFIAEGAAIDTAATVAGVIANDLAHSGYFQPLPPESFIEKIGSLETAPQFASWRQVQARNLVVGQVTSQGSKMTMAFKLYDVNTGELVKGTSFTASAKVSRRIAHKMGVPERHPKLRAVSRRVRVRERPARPHQDASHKFQSQRRRPPSSRRLLRRERPHLEPADRTSPSGSDQGFRPKAPIGRHQPRRKHLRRLRLGRAGQRLPNRHRANDRHDRR